MAFEAMFKHGHPLMIDYTPTAFVPAGTVLSGVVSGIASVIAHHDLEANVLGAVAAGGGVYEVINADNAVNFAKVGWDPVTKKVATAGSVKFGFIASNGARGANTTCYVKHEPTV